MVTVAHQEDEVYSRTLQGTPDLRLAAQPARIRAICNLTTQWGLPTSDLSSICRYISLSSINRVIGSTKPAESTPHVSGMTGGKCAFTLKHDFPALPIASA